jgi:hypothetical protein
VENYLWYLENVLGLKAPIWPASAPSAETPMADSTSLNGVQTSAGVVRRPPILFLQATPWSSAAEDLFQKMREAMKLQKSQVSVLFASQVSASELQVAVMAADRVVCFSSEIFQSLNKENENKFLTHSPEELLRKPELKKQAWMDLQGVMRSLGLL